MGNIATPPAHYYVDLKKRALCKALAEGVDAMRQDARTSQRWMTPNPGDMRLVEIGGNRTLTRYEIRVRRSRFHNVWKEQIEEAVSRVFSRSFVLADWPDFVEEFAQNVDLEGRDINTYERDCFETALTEGLHLTLVDHPVAEGRRTLEEYRTSGDRPYWVPIEADDLIEAVPQRSGELSEARIKFREQSRSLNRETGDYEEKSSEVIKLFVFDNGVQVRAFRRGQTQWVPGPWRVMNPVLGQLSGIPLVPIYGGARIAPLRAWPYFRDAAEIQAGIWLKSSEKDWLGSRSAVPLLFQSGVPVNKETGQPIFGSDPEGRLWSDEVHADAKIVETSGQALGFLAGDIERDKQTVKASIQPHLNRPSGTMTATEIGAREIRAKSILGLLSKLCVLSVQRKLEYTCQMAGFGPETWGTVELPNSLGDNQPDKAELKELKASGSMSDQGFWEQYKRAGGVTEDFDVEEEVQRLAAERNRLGY